MPTGDFPPPEGMMWTDAFGWVPVPQTPFRVTRMVEIINSPHFGFDLYSDPTCIAECEI